MSKLKHSKKFSHSSQQWLKRQLNDPYTQAAVKCGYRSRAAFKLLEIEKKFNLIRDSRVIIDLGAAPGSWSQVVIDNGYERSPHGNKQFGLHQSLSANSKKGQPCPNHAADKILIAIDLLPIDSLAANHAYLLRGDFTTSTEQITQVLQELNCLGADLVLSDMAPNTVGNQGTDHLRIMNLVEQAWQFCLSGVLNPHGHFVAKLWQGSQEQAFVNELKPHFAQVSRFKPKSSRSESSEIFIVAQHRLT